MGERLRFDPRDSSLFVDGRRESTFAQLRESDGLAVDREGPVPIYSLVRYAEVERAYKEADVFSPGAGLTLDAFDPEAYETPSRMLETARPDLHRALKGAMQGSFRGDGLAAIRAEMEARVDRFLTQAAGGEVEFVGAFARAAGTAAMLGLLGVPTAAAERLTPALNAIGELDFGGSPGAMRQRQQTELRVLRELARAVRDCHRTGGADGLIGALLEAEVEGQPLSEREVALNCFNVAIAGTGASQHTLAAAAAVWADHGLEPAAAGDPKRRRQAVDETLRWLTPVLHLTRILTADVEIAGQQLPRGAGVCLWNISANRDEDVFEDAARFDPDRPPGRNLAFGAGPQYCLGAEAIRTQLDALLAGIARHGVRFELTAPPRRIPSNAIAAVAALRLRVDR